MNILDRLEEAHFQTDDRQVKADLCITTHLDRGGPESLVFQYDPDDHASLQEVAESMMDWATALKALSIVTAPPQTQS